MTKPKADLIDNENPQWTKADVAKAKRLGDLPPALQVKLRGRPPSAVKKERISIRLSAEVLAPFRASGPGWQTRMENALKQWLKKNPQQRDAKRG